ncbi:collagen alpha-1(III) chain-like [Bos javanicus]|uniref:collagen alpha-1(III) chain-like n=1 Tax=Bos javanicus TaxID=9906 RepID=UPI002AA5EEEC|nr:collagen alpha-1(III) chain-like [Bos javanicus]
MVQGGPPDPSATPAPGIQALGSPWLGSVTRFFPVNPTSRLLKTWDSQRSNPETTKAEPARAPAALCCGRGWNHSVCVPVGRGGAGGRRPPPPRFCAGVPRRVCREAPPRDAGSRRARPPAPTQPWAARGRAAAAPPRVCAIRASAQCGRGAAGGRCGVAAGGGGAPRAVRCVPAAGRGRAPGRPRGARGSPRAPQSSDPSERQAGDSWSEGSSGRRRASRLEGSEEDWAVRVRAWLGLLPGQVQEEQAPGPEPPGGSAGIPRASPVRASRKSTGPPIPLVPRVEERPGSRCQSRGSTCGAMMLPLSTIGGQGREEVQTRPPQRRALPFERTTGQRREPARKNARVSAKQVPTCPMPGFCFAFYMDSKDSEFDSQPSPGSSRGGSKYTSPAKPRAKYKEIQAWECPLCCLSVLYIS